jgi:hypothetical protein
MASKTQMYELLRLIDQGAGQNVVDAAVQCWQDLPADTRQEMAARGRSADLRRARLWAAAWEGAEQAALQKLDDLYSSLEEDLQGAGIVLAPASLEWIES